MIYVGIYLYLGGLLRATIQPTIDHPHLSQKQKQNQSFRSFQNITRNKMSEQDTSLFSLSLEIHYPSSDWMK